MILLTIDEPGFNVILLFRYLNFLIYFLNGIFWLQKNRSYALNQAICYTSWAFAFENLSYAIIDTLALIKSPYPLSQMNVFRDIYSIFLGLILVFFFIASLIIDISWETLKSRKQYFFIIGVEYIIFLAIFIPNDTVVSSGAIEFDPIGNLAWLIFLIFMILIYWRLFRVMRLVDEKRNAARSFIIGISIMLLGFIYFLLINLIFKNPTYLMLHGDNFIYIIAGLIFLFYNLKSARKS